MATKELRKQAEKIFKNEYPNAKLDKFEFGYNLDNDGKLKSIIKSHQNNQIGY